MDCPCEQSLINMKLEGHTSISHFEFDLAKRTLVIIHHQDAEPISRELKSLGLGAKLISTSLCERLIPPPDTSSLQRKILRWVLIINFGFFVIEASIGVLYNSMGLLADSLDMLADALVYGMSLMVVGSTILRKKQVAKFSGYIQILLAVWGLTEVLKRFFYIETAPSFIAMIAISAMALVANSICLWLLQSTKSNEVHIKASVIFSANDIIINLGVIIAGVLVWWLGSGIPDLVVGIIIFLIVIRGAIRILKLAK